MYRRNNYIIKYKASPCQAGDGGMGVARIFFLGGELFFKKFSKKFPKIFKNLLKNCKNFPKNFLKYSKNIFQNFNKPSIQLLRVWMKRLFAGNLCENFRKFWKIFLIKLRKCIILAYFPKNLTNHGFNFCAFGRNTQFW